MNIKEVYMFLLGIIFIIVFIIILFFSFGHWTNKDLLDRNLAYYSTTSGALILKDLR